MRTMHRFDLSLPTLQAAYRSGRLTPRAMVARLHADMLAEDAVLDRRIWIRRATLPELQAHAAALDGRDPASLPLYGIPFAVKDNIDVASLPTTAGCPDYAYLPERSATAVQRLVDAGAIPVGKTNLDQFATGLVGVRSPYGACRNAIDGDWISGGSSAGSAVAVALGLASFALGTDTAGSGRVPAMLNNLIGCKPSRGRIPATGVVPACRTLDVVSIFALTADDAAAVLAVAEGDDGIDPYARHFPGLRGSAASDASAGWRLGTGQGDPAGRPGVAGAAHGAARTAFRADTSVPFTFGMPRPDDLPFFGNADGPRLFAQAVQALKSLGGTPVEVDLRPFFAAAKLLYDGPWLAERYAAIRPFIERSPESLHPVTRAITLPAAELRTVDAFEAMYALQAVRRATEPVWRSVDCLVTPTAGTTYTIAEVEADRLRLNANMGAYTNFVNLLDLAAVAVPTGTIDGAASGGRPAGGLPWGVSLVAPAGDDLPLLRLAARLHALGPITVGATGHAPHRLGDRPGQTSDRPADDPGAAHARQLDASARDHARQLAASAAAHAQQVQASAEAHAQRLRTAATADAGRPHLGATGPSPQAPGRSNVRTVRADAGGAMLANVAQGTVSTVGPPAGAARAAVAGPADRGSDPGARPPVTAVAAAPAPAATSAWLPIAVCGAHMAGLPLNGQLLQRGARFLRTDTTAPCYRFYLLPGGPPHRPGLVRVGEGQGGAAIEVEIWELPEAAYGGFVAAIPSPLGIGSVLLAGRGSVQGFVCEAVAADGATDITALGGWRRHLADVERKETP